MSAERRWQPVLSLRVVAVAFLLMFASSAVAATIIGDDTGEMLEGTNNDDDIFGNGGQDEILGKDGADDVEGGTGGDDIKGEDGWDHLEGGPGNDVVRSGDGHNTLIGDAGQDDLQGIVSQTINEHEGGADDDLIDARNGQADTVVGGGGFDTCRVDGNQLDDVSNCEN